MTRPTPNQTRRVRAPEPLYMTSSVVLRSPADLRPNPRNARVHSKRQIKQIERSMKATGFIGAIVVDEHMTILAGHARWEAAKRAGLERVPTLMAEGLSEPQKRMFVLADNKLGENSSWDRKILAGELIDLKDVLSSLNLELDLTGFEPAEADALFADFYDPETDPLDIPPPVPHTPVTRPGDMWHLGEHRILCGDARSPGDLDRLMGGTRAHMAILDPPYNDSVSHVQGRGRIKHPEFAFASGEMTSNEYIAFLAESLRNVVRVSRDGSPHYVFMDWRHIAELVTAARDIYGAFLNICVWTKSNPGQGSFYRSQHEMIGVFRVGKGSSLNNVQLGRFGRNRSNVWAYPGVSGFAAGRLDLLKLHPTTKPIALIADAIRDCTKRNDLVLDTFLGSGSAILAAGKIGRHCYGIEYEPRYVDVAIVRWMNATKLEAVHAGGQTFSELKASRSGAQADGAGK